MKNKFNMVALFALLSWSSLSIAGVLMSEWTEGTSRYCKYSDGVVIQISFGATCSSTN